MGSKIADLLRWRDKVELKDKKGLPLLDKDTKEPIVVYIRVIGDEDLKDVYQDARVASANMRAKLRDTKSKEWAEIVSPINNATKEECTQLLIQARTQNLYSEAAVAVTREELPELKEVAVEPDAPTLEEQEKLDAAKMEQALKYQTNIQEYINARIEAMRSEIEAEKLDKLREDAKGEVGDILAYEAFANAIIAGKVSKACYLDKTYRELAFEDTREFLQSKEVIRQQLILAYTNLEMGSEDLKN